MKQKTEDVVSSTVACFQPSRHLNEHNKPFNCLSKLKGTGGCSIVQAVSSQNIARIRRQVSPCGICGEKSGNASGSSPSTSDFICQYDTAWLRWSRGSVLAFSTQVRGFKPGRSRRIFKGEEILNTPSFGGEVNPSVPCRRFAACKRSLMA